MSVTSKDQKNRKSGLNNSSGDLFMPHCGRTAVGLQAALPVLLVLNGD